MSGADYALTALGFVLAFLIGVNVGVYIARRLVARRLP
jgi:uncharacterized protein YneF (UPF0154 family)